MKKIIHAITCLILLMSIQIVGSKNAWCAPADYDPTFGNIGPGQSFIDFPADASGGLWKFNAIRFQPDGKIVLAGYVEFSSNSSKMIVLARIRVGGSTDTTFGNQGIFRGDLGIWATEVRDLQVLSDGSLILAGHATISGLQQVFVAKLSIDGQPDASFGTNGVTVIPSLTGESVSGIAVQTSGKIVLVGNKASAGERSSYVVRLTSAGQVDTTFSCSGTCTGLRVFSAPAGTNSNSADAIALLPDDKILIAGVAGTDAGFLQQHMLRRLQADGSDDSSFGNGGVVTQHQRQGSLRIGNLKLQSNGKILVANIKSEFGGFPDHLGLAQFMPEGAIDSSFGSNGLVFLDVAYAHRNAFVAVANNGAIYLAGSVVGPPAPVGQNAFIARLTATGTIDGSSSLGGKAFYPEYPLPGQIDAFSLDAVGRPVFVGNLQLIRLRTVGAEVVPNPASIAFSVLTQGETRLRSVVLSNPGPVPITIQPPTIAGSGLPFSIEDNLCQVGIPAAGSCTFSVRFSGASFGTYSTNVELRGNFASSTAPVLIPVTALVQDASTPETTISSAPTGTISGISASFSFASTKPGTFECSLDGGAFFTCVSPYVWDQLALGSRTFSVRALDLVGNVDPTPAQASFNVISGSNTKLWYQSMPGDPVGGGQSRFYQAPPDSLVVGTVYGGNEVRVTATSGSMYSLLTLVGTNGSKIQAGAYEAAQRFPFQGIAPGLDFSGEMHVCSQLGGRFVVLEVAYNPDNTIQKLAVNFEQRCELDGPPLYGELRINSTIPFTFQQPAGSAAPNQFSFKGKIQVPPGSVHESNEATLYGMNASSPISITGGEYSVNGGAWTAVAGMVNNRDRVKLRASASLLAGGLVTSTLTVGGVSAGFQLNTYDPLYPQTALWHQNSPGEYAGGGQLRLYQAPTDIFLVGASYASSKDLQIRIRSGSVERLLSLIGPSNSRIQVGAYENALRFPDYGTASGLNFSGHGQECNQLKGRFVVLEAVYNPDNSVQKLAVNFEQRCSVVGAPQSAVVYGELRINSTIPFTFQKPAGSTTPDSFAFQGRNQVLANTIYESSETSIYGITSVAPISIVGGEYSINGGAWTSAAGLVSNRDQVKVRTISSALAGGLVTATLTVGGVSAGFQLNTYDPALARSALWFSSSPGEEIGSGQTRMFLAPTDDLLVERASSFDEGVKITVASGSDTYALDLLGPNGSRIEVGSYEVAELYPSQLIAAGLNFSHKGRGCNILKGRFVVLEVVFNTDNSIQKLAVNFEQRCEGIEPPLYGEVRINSAIPFTFQKPIGSSIPDAFSFPPKFHVQPGTVHESNFVTIYGINVRAPISVVGGEYSINGGTWTSASGLISNRDQVKVRTTSSASPAGLATATLTVGGVSAGFQLITFNPYMAQNALWFQSTPGDYIGDGQTRLYSSPPDSVVTRNMFSPNDIQVSVTSGSSSKSLTLIGPNGTRIQAGTYEGATRYPFQGTGPGLNFSGDGRECNQFSGRFVVLEAVFNPDNSVQKLAVNFEQRCENSMSPLFGEVRINSTIPFTFQEQYFPSSQLTLQKTGTGSGTVTSVPTGIDCGASCSTSITSNTVVTLTATPAPGSSFLGWSGITCTGGNSNATCEFSISAATTVTANFNVTAGSNSALHDLNDDGKSDIIWRNGITGTNWYWSMNGTTIAAQGPITSLPLDWQIQSTAVDFDGDGKSDILLRNMTTGQPWIWFMNGNSIIGGGALPTLADLNWTIAGTGDLNGDGKGDVIWRNTSTGANWWWALNGTSIIAQGAITTLPPEWQIQSTLGDFNGDGKTDILWRNMTTGQPWIWFMNGNSITSSGPLPTLSDLTWTIAGTGDLNGDGKHDVVWRNTATGANWYWSLDGTTITAQGPVTTLPTDWQIQCTSADFDGDGKADILLRNLTTGQPWIWYMNGNTITGGGPLPTLSDLSWQIKINK